MLGGNAALDWQGFLSEKVINKKIHSKLHLIQKDICFIKSFFIYLFSYYYIITSYNIYLFIISAGLGLHIKQAAMS